MLIEKYELEVFTPPCEPGAERFTAIARLQADIHEVFPYLNASLRGAIYNAPAPAITWTKGGHNVAFHPYQIAVSNVLDRDAAIKEVEGLVKLVNRIWEQRDQITPDFVTHQRPTPMAVYKLLPGTNCRACGQPTCFTFALRLAAGQAPLEKCEPLWTDAYQEQREALLSLIGAGPGVAIGRAI
jgi:ArsR family metal-binding transcriptional regulator